MFERKNVVCYGDECYLHNLGFSAANSPSETDPPIYHHQTYLDGNIYDLDISHSEQTNTFGLVPDVAVYFIDSAESLLKAFSSQYIFTIPSLLVLVKDGGFERNLISQECKSVFGESICLEMNIDQTKHPKDFAFKDTLSHSILNISNNNNTYASLFEYECLWWSIPSSYISSQTSANLPVKFKTADNAEYLLTSIEHDDGDLHSFSFRNQETTQIVEIIRSLPENACIKRLVIIDCDGILSLSQLFTMTRGLEYLIVIDTNVAFDVSQEVFPHLKVLTCTINLKNLKHLDLSGSTFENFPAEILSNLDHLEYINLSNCFKYVDEPLSVMGNLKNLKHLDLSRSTIKKFPAETLSNLHRLEYLDLSKCFKYVDEPPSVIGNLKNLKHLDLSRSIFISLPGSFRNLDCLEYLDLSGCFKYVDEPLSVIGNLKNLKHLDLSECNFTSLPASFCNLDRLEYLDLSSCFDDVVEPPSVIGNLKNLKHLGLSECNFTSLPASFCNLDRLEYLDLSKCFKDVDEPPSVIGYLKNLKHLGLSWSRFTSLPASFCNLDRLEYLDLSKCFKDVDEPPSVIGNLKNLKHLDLSKSTFKKFPAEILSNLHRLEYLDLTRCFDDVDEPPSVIGNLKNLKHLGLGWSNFTRVPQSFSKLDRLKYLEIHGKTIVFPPPIIMQRPAQDIIQYLKELEQKPTENREAKIMVVGQEEVGKSTFVKSAANISIFSLFSKTKPPEKTDGIEISNLKLDSSEVKVYDLAGDVDYHNTHALFFSPNCLHLAVFDLSNVTVSKNSRSTDQFCRLELWLQTIASQDLNPYVIIVGTHLDHPMLNKEVKTRIRNALYTMLLKYRSQHVSSTGLSANEKCFLCNPEKVPKTFGPCLESLSLSTIAPDAQSESSSSNIPHVLGYYEVSGTTNKNVKKLKKEIDTAVTGIKRYTKTNIIPKRWLKLRQLISNQLLQENDLREQPIATLTSIQKKAASEAAIHMEQSFVAMLRFFHSQGDFLWYEDIPEMKDVVILDPQWLSNQLCKLISHLPNVDATSEGFLDHSRLPEIWNNMSGDNRSRLMTVFRRVGLCISVTDDVDLFPCKLPIGWPDREMWPPFPKPKENQTSLLFQFSFVPASLFPDLIVAINKRKDSFPPNVSPLYYCFNAVYITNHQDQCHLHTKLELHESGQVSSAAWGETNRPLYHRVHMEMTPHTNSLKVTIRGPQPCCQVSDIRSMIAMVKSQRYPGITYKEHLICPECELKKLQKPSTFDFEQVPGGFCSKGHEVGSLDELLIGKVGATSTVNQPKREFVEALDDHFCPKLFVVLPVNLDSLSLKDRFVYSFIRDGYAVHLLCECPDQWHFLSSPGFRIGRPKEFFEKYGGRVCKMLRVISALGTPFKVASALDPHCKAGAAVANAAGSISKEMKSLLDDYLEKYPHLKASLGPANDDLKDLKSSRGLQRSELSRFLDVAAPGRDFGPLVCTYVDKYNNWLWLCEEPYKQYEIYERQ